MIDDDHPPPCIDTDLNTLQIDIQRETLEYGPSDNQIERWVSTLTRRLNTPSIELTIRLVDIDEMTQLNHTYRGKNKPTNVLSFPVDLPPEISCDLLGDIIICNTVVANEAEEQAKNLDAHWAHMVTHGTLHLLGYDHITEVEANEMEGLEINILADLNYPNPYACNVEPKNE